MSDFEPSPNVKQDIVPEVKIFQDTFVFGNECAHVNVNADNLRKDFISEAIKQGVNNQEALEFAAKTRFYIGRYSDYLEKTYNQNPSLKQFIDLWITKVRKPLNPIAGVWKEDDGSIGCFIDVPEIVETINKGKSVPNFRSPREAAKEIREMSLLQAFHSVWSHERQHLIQLVKPNVSEAVDRSIKRSSRLTKIALTALGGGTGLYLTTVTLPMPPEIKIPLARCSMISMLGGVGGGALGVINLTHSQYLVEHEKESYDYQSVQQFVGKTPFKVSFEK